MPSRQTTLRLLLALLVGGALPFLPGLLATGLGPGADLSGRLGLSTGISAGTFAILFSAGVLTSLTPCVYPLIPITVGVFGARQADHRARSVGLSATYVGGIAAMYSALGVFAALSGKAFGSALSSPWVVAILAVFLVALAASMFGAFEIALPSSVQEKLQAVKGGGFGGAFGMGLVAGIVAAPCTGPVLAGVLTYVATTHSAVLGFWMLFTYALGMGVLFFVLGTTSLRLPRSGAWMETVKSVLGVALIAAAVTLLLPLLPRRGELPFDGRTVALVSAVLAFGAVLGGAFSLSFHGDSREKALKGLALIALFAAIGLQFGWAGTPRGDRSDAAQARIQWFDDEAKAVATAKATGKPMVIDFFADWCEACKQLDVQTFSDPVVKKEVAEKFVALRIDSTKDTDENERLQKKYGIPGLPTVLLLACKDEPKPQAECSIPQDGPGRVTGFIEPPEMLSRMRQVAQ